MLKKLSVITLSGVLGLALVACNNEPELAEVDDTRIVLSQADADAVEVASTEATTSTNTSTSEFTPLQFQLIRDYYKDADGDNFPSLAVSMLSDADIHQFPNENSQVISKLTKGAEVFLAQKFANGWSYIHHNQDSGYVKSDKVDDSKVKALKLPDSKIPKGTMEQLPATNLAVNPDNFKSVGKKKPNTIFWKNWSFDYENVSDFNYGNSVIYGEPSSEWVYKMIGPAFSPYDGKLSYIDGHRHRVALKMWENKFGVGQEFEITDAQGNAYRYKVVERQQEVYSKNNGYIGASFSNGTGILDAFNFGVPYEAIIIQYCDDATNDPNMNFFLCLPVLDTDK